MQVHADENIVDAIQRNEERMGRAIAPEEQKNFKSIAMKAFKAAGEDGANIYEVRKNQHGVWTISFDGILNKEKRQKIALLISEEAGITTECIDFFGRYY